MKKTWVIIIFSMLFLPVVVHGYLIRFSGEAFSDPSYKVQMPEKWKKQGIKYEQWAQGSDLVVSTDQHLYPAVLPIINDYAKKNNLKIAVKEAVCGITKGRLARKAVDVTTDCCPPGKQDRLPGLKFHTLGIAPMAFFVNAANPVSSITYKQARLIFQGKIRRWSEVHGRNMTIHPVARLHCKDRPGMWRLMLASEDMFGANIYDVKTIRDNLDSVTSEPYSIGFESLWQVEKYRHRDRVKVLKIDGLDPADPSVLASGEYPLYLTYVLTYWEDKDIGKPHARKLVEYIIKEMEKVKKPFHIVTSPVLRKSGWKFRDNELIGENRPRQ